MSRLCVILIAFSNAYAQIPEDSIILNYKDSVNIHAHNKEKWYSKLAQVYFQNNNLDSSKKYYSQALLFKNNLPQNAYILNNLGVLYYHLDDLDSSEYFYKQAKDIYVTIGSHTKAAYCVINLGIIYQESGNYKHALKYLINASNILEEKTANRALASCYNTMAIIYSRQKNYQMALKYHKQSLKIRQHLSLDRPIAASYNNLGIIFRTMGEYDSALHYYHSSLKIKRQLADKKGIGVTLNNIGRIHLDQKEYSLAKSYFTDALKLRSQISDKPGSAITLNNLGELYLEKGAYDKSLHFLNDAGNILDSLGLLEERRINLERKLMIYDIQGYHNKALVISKRLLIIKDSILNKEKAKALIEMQAKYESEKKIQEIALLEQGKDIQQAELDLRRSWNIMLILGSILLFIIGLLTTSRWRREKHSKQKIEVLLQELHHRIKNNLQMLASIFAMYSRSIKDEIALEAVKGGENRVNAMAIIHKKLYTSSKKPSINLNDYINELVWELAESYGHGRGKENIMIKVENVELDVDMIIPIGLITTELVSNSFKYAFAPSGEPYLLVEVKKNEKNLIIHIEDNGNGFQFDQISDKSMGIKIIEALAQQLGGKIKWDTLEKVIFTMQMKIKE